MEIGRVTQDPKRGGGVFPGYNFLYHTGQETSYRTGDDAWVKDNVFKGNLPTGKTWVNPIDVDNFLNLQFSNPFGSKARWHNLGTNLEVDCHTGLMWYSVEQTTDTWNNAIDDSLGTDHGGNNSTVGYTDWFLPNVQQIWNIVEQEAGAGGGLNYPPFNFADDVYWCSTTRHVATTSGLTVFTSGLISSSGKGNSNQYLFCRKHF